MSRANASSGPSQWLQEALRHHQAGHLDQAEALYQKILQQLPEQPDATRFLGVLAGQRGDHATAAQLIAKAITLKPGDASMHNDLGLSLRNAGDYAQAAEQFKRALDLNRNFSEAQAHLATMLLILDRPAEALPLFQQCAGQNPDLLYYMGLCCQKLGRRAEEVSCYEQVLALQPNHPRIHQELGIALMELGQIDKAEQLLRVATQRDPGQAVAWYNLADCLHNQGKIEEASTCFDKAFALEGNPVVRLKKTLLKPVVPIFPDTASIDRVRAEFETELDAWLANPPSLHDPYRQLGCNPFFLAFHARNNRSLNQKIAALYAQACPALTQNYATSYVPGKRIRLGILSGFFRDHTISKLYQGIIEQLPREQFELIVLRPRGGDSVTAQIDQSADQTIEFPEDLAAAHALIRDAKLDILFYPDIGMHAFTYLLAFARFAPVQVVGWGHPDTTGIPAIDYYLSQTDLEPMGAETAYSEKLVRLQELPCYYRAQTPTMMTRAELALPADKNLYLCPQTLFKLHPDFDTILADILRRDVNGQLVLIEGARTNWTDQLKQRFVRSMPDVAERILFLPHMPQTHFRALLAHADALLDPMHFGGGNTHYEAFAMGVPMVTLPGEFMRGRVAYACYRRMGMDDLIACDTAHYAELAHRLATDRAWRSELQAILRSRATVLYENKTAINELADFFVRAVKEKGVP